MIERTPQTCSAAGCIRPAVDWGYRDGVVLWAVCDDHLSAARPMFEHRGEQVTVAGKAVLTAIEAAMSFGDSMHRKNHEIASDILEALFAKPAMRGLIHVYLEERDEG